MRRQGTEEWMEDMDSAAERERQALRKKRIEEMRRRKRRTQMLHRCVPAGAALLLLLGAGVGLILRGNRGRAATEQEQTAQQAASQTQEQSLGTPQAARPQKTPSQESEPARQPQQNPDFTVYSTAQTEGFGEDIISEYGVLIDAEAGEILTGRQADVRMNPASMTKILTVLTAADALKIRDGSESVLDDGFAMTIEITDYSYVNDCSNVGFEVGEVATVRDLFYGTVLPSGADAALGLATYVAGSQEAFMELMNQKLEQLGLSATSHFTNCVGLYDDDHYTTVCDLAVMLKAAADNGFCRQVLSAHTYNTSFTEQHPEGLLLSNWFLRRIEDRDTHGEVLCGKTGFVNQSGSCAASLALDQNGREYLCVTAGSTSSWQCIDDQTELFQRYLPQTETQAKTDTPLSAAQ